MDVRGTQPQATSAMRGNSDRRGNQSMPDQFSRLAVDKGNQPHNYENLRQQRRHDQPAQRQLPPKGEDDSKDLLKAGDIVKSRWRVLHKIGGGGFGEIYEAVDTCADPQKVANLTRGISDASELCSNCAHRNGVGGGGFRRNGTSLPMSQSDSAMRTRLCANCGQEFFTSSALQRHSSEDGPESADSGNSSGHSDGQGLAANNSNSDNHIVAIKTESNTQPKQMLRMEVAVMRRLKEKKNFCELIACGKNARINYIVMTLQGKSLSELRKKAPTKSFSRSTSLRIICKCLDAVESLHSIGFLHRDIKPSNFCLRRDNPTEVCLLDFGLVRQYTTAGSTMALRPPRSSAGFRGTVRYASINAHKYRELGRHDDLWSMYYMLVEFLSGQLPWHRRNDKEVVKKLKMDEDPVKLGVDAGLPQCIAAFWSNHLDSLNYYTAPKYSELKKVIENWLSANGVNSDDPYDWQLMTRAESATTFAPMFKRNQYSSRQFVPNAKRTAHHESTGCLKRLDKRGFGSNMELKRMESEGETGYGGRSTAAMMDDAITNQNKTQVPGCITMATENQLNDDVNDADADEHSAKVDGEEKMMASHLDLAAIGAEPRKKYSAPALESTDKQFLATSTPGADDAKRSHSSRRQKFLGLFAPRRTNSDTRKPDRSRK